MKTTIKFLFTLLILFAFSCSQETTVDPLPTDLEGVSAKASSKQMEDFFLYIDEEGNPGAEVIGSSATLHRTNNGVTLNVKTSNLEPGDAYTVWFVFWNSGVLGGPPSGAHYAAGHVIGANGKGNFSAHLSEGDVSGVLGEGGPLTNPEGAEFHIVIRSHGPAIPGMIDEQIHTVDGGCTGVPATDPCADHQVAIFLGTPEPV